MSYFSKISSFFSSQTFTPKLVTCLQEGYTKSLFTHDLLAGISIGIIALPLAMAFAIGSGVDPERGLFTAIVAGFLISLLGGSRVQIGGPTGAYVIIVYTIIQKHGYEGLALATLLAAIILIILGVTKCGNYIRFIPYPVTTGFTTGIATVIFTTQIKDFFGLHIPKPSVEFLDRIYQYWDFKNTVHLPAVWIALISLGIIITCRKISKKIPAAMIAVIGATCVSYFFSFDVDTIESKFGPIPLTLPIPSFPEITLDGLQAVFPDAITIALLGAIESLLSAMIADGMTGFRHRSNTELIGQGIANIGSIIFGGIPATGAVARTTANIQLGAKTPFAGMIHAVTILLLMLAFSPLAGKIPLSALAAILIYIAYVMSDLEHFIEILRGPKTDALVLLTTFSLTVFIDLTVAVQAGVLLAGFLFLKHMSEKTTIKACQLAQNDTLFQKENPLWKTPPPPGVEVFEIEGPFFFGVSDLPNEALRLHPTRPKVFILRMHSVPFIDTTGVQALKQFYHKCKHQNIIFYLCEVRKDVYETLQHCSIKTAMGDSHILPTLQDALNAAEKTLH